MTILNVDDNEPSRYVRSHILSHAGFEVYEAGTGGAALQVITERNPDLILLDMNLPDVHGIEVCRQIKSSPVSASIIVLQISASSTTAPHAKMALDSGADAYLTEPVDPDVLVATVKALLRLRKAERDLSAANERLLQLNQDLHRSNEDLEQFAFAASHDLQEPLRTVISFVGLLQRTAREKLAGAELEYLSYIIEGSRRMRVLIDDLLRYSQIGQRREPSQVVDLNIVLAWTIENLREGISDSAAQISADQLPCVIGDESQLGHVLQNLIGNAIKYAQPGVPPEVHLSAGREGDFWLIRVRDNGIGIDETYFQLVFAAFKRLHGKEVPGTGIGLAICRKVIEVHGGRIWVESKRGCGSTFCFTLPANPIPSPAV
jgi:signal transduction histidine kinase